MNQDRLNHLMVLHVYKTLTDTLDLIEVVNELLPALSTGLQRLEILCLLMYFDASSYHNVYQCLYPQ